MIDGSNNPYNPNPKENVLFGLQSFEEMFIGYYEVLWLNKKDARPFRQQQK